jgi:hypothetical protein
VPLASAYCVAHHPDRGNTQRVSAFESWLFDEAARDAADLQAAQLQAVDAPTPDAHGRH